MNWFQSAWKKIKDKMPKIRKDDLDALGEMAGFVGTYMNDFVSKTDSDARGKLFKTNINPRDTITKALRTPDTDVAQEVIPDNIRLAADGQPVPAGTPSTPPQDPNRPVQAAGIPVQDSVPVTDPNQMMFAFIDKPITAHGNVGEVIQHFNKRLDNIEESIRILKMHLVDIKVNLPKRRIKEKDEPKETT
jgi:hypothetical protein